MDCHIPSVRAGVAPIFQNFPAMQGMMLSWIKLVNICHFQAVRTSHDSHERYMAPYRWEPIFSKSITNNSITEEEEKKALEFWCVDIWPLVQSYFSPPFFIRSIRVIFWLNELDLSFTLVDYDILMMQFCAFTTLVYSHPKKFSLLILV